MKLRSFFYVLATLVLVLLLLSAGGFYWIASHSPLALLRNGQVVDPAAAMFVPKQAPVMVSMLVNPEELEAVRQVLARPGERKAARAELNQLKETLLANTGIDYRRDVEPWLGDEITYAVTTPDIDRNPGNGRQLGYLLAVATKNPERSQEFLDTFWEKQRSLGADLVVEQYKGVKIAHSRAAKKLDKKKLGAVAAAAVGDRFILFANSPKVLREAVNNVQAAELNLTSSSAYQEALQRLTQRQIGLTFVNLSTLIDFKLGKAGETKNLKKTEELVNNSASLESFAVAFGFNPKGLLAETALLRKDESDSSVQTAPFTLQPLEKPVGALQYLPTNSAFAAAGKDLRQLWSQLSAVSDTTLSRLVNSSLIDLQNHWGIDLPQDIFSWVQGEYALGWFPRGNGEQADWIFVAEKSADTDSAVERLDAIAQQQGFSVGSLLLEKQNIVAWTKLTTAPAEPNQGPLTLKAQAQGVHTTVGKYKIFATSVEAMDEALKAPQNSLVKAPDFEASIAALSRPNQGYIYINWPATQTTLERQLPMLNLVELIAKPVFNHLRSLTFSSYGNDNNIVRGGIFVRLASEY